MKANKNELLSSIGQRRVQVVQKEAIEKTSSISMPNETWATSPTISLEEIISHPKRCRSGDKGKEKVGASVWHDVRMALTRAHNIVTAEELKEILGVPSHKMVNCHIHKLVQVIPCCSLFFFFFWVLVFVLI